MPHCPPMPSSRSTATPQSVAQCTWWLDSAGSGSYRMGSNWVLTTGSSWCHYTYPTSSTCMHTASRALLPTSVLGICGERMSGPSSGWRIGGTTGTHTRFGSPRPSPQRLSITVPVHEPPHPISNPRCRAPWNTASPMQGGGGCDDHKEGSHQGVGPPTLMELRGAKIEGPFPPTMGARATSSRALYMCLLTQSP